MTAPADLRLFSCLFSLAQCLSVEWPWEGRGTRCSVLVVPIAGRTESSSSSISYSEGSNLEDDQLSGWECTLRRGRSDFTSQDFLGDTTRRWANSTVTDMEIGVLRRPNASGAGPFLSVVEKSITFVFCEWLRWTWNGNGINKLFTTTQD